MSNFGSNGASGRGLGVSPVVDVVSRAGASSAAPSSSWVEKPCPTWSRGCSEAGEKIEVCKDETKLSADALVVRLPGSLWAGVCAPFSAGDALNSPSGSSELPFREIGGCVVDCPREFVCVATLAVDACTVVWVPVAFLGSSEAHRSDH